MIKFSDPGYIWFFAIVVLFVALVFYSRWRKNQDINLFAGKKLSRRILDDFSPGLKHFKEYLLLGSLLFFGIALIGPQVGKKLTEVKRKGIDIIIALDTSTSMNAEDVKPNRLMRAKYETGKFIDGLRGDRVGLVAFAGTSYLQCPLTLDYSAAKLFLDAMDTGVIGTQGTAIADAIGTSLKAFKSEEKKHKVLVIVSDGEDHEGDIPSITEEAVNEGVIIFSVGIGTLSGAPIPVYDKGEIGFKRDRGGRVVTTALEEFTLRQIASSTGGKYYNMEAESNVFGKIYKQILGMEKKEIRSHEYSDYHTRYQIFLAIGLALMIVEIFIPEKVHHKNHEI